MWLCVDNAHNPLLEYRPKYIGIFVMLTSIMVSERVMLIILISFMKSSQT